MKKAMKSRVPLFAATRIDEGKVLELGNCDTRFVTAEDKKTGYLIPSNKDYFYEITGESDPIENNTWKPNKIVCSEQDFPINWVGSDYVSNVPTVTKEWLLPQCYNSGLLFGRFSGN